jgi:glycyl-tRNA synthetase beta chain
VAELLLEIGCEEIPASWLAGLTEQLRQRFTELATRELLDAQDVVALATPRRLVLKATVAARQPDREEKVWGPSLKVAKDASGQWTGAAQGFARKSGVAPEALQQAAKDGAPASELNLLFTKTVTGRESRDVLPSLLAVLLRALAFPKRMSWDAWIEDGKGAFPFGRPIRWIVFLLDGKVVPFTIHELSQGARGAVAVEAGALTYGHRFLPRGAAGGPLAVRSFADLQESLRRAFVLLDPREREARIRDGLAQGGASREGKHELVTEWCDLVEFPAVVFGAIPAEFQALPREVLETVLVHHQKYIPLSEAGRVTRFAAVTNTDGRAQDAIVRGMERVVVARLRDGAFFYQEDRKRRLQDRLDDLAGVTFHQALGSYREKASRLARLVDVLRDAGTLPPDAYAPAREAALLAKADLTTLMVREFPELQGVMGALYLEAQGDVAPELVDAVRWHYHPLSPEEGGPLADALRDRDARAFAAVSLVDKLDTLAGYFGLGLVPSGSSDPFGLRRAAQGAVRVLLDFWKAGPKGGPSLRALVKEALAGFGASLKKPPAEAASDLEVFLTERLRYVLVSRGFAADEVDAVLGAREPDALDDPQECARRVKALHNVRLEATDDFTQLAAAFKRARNILGKEQGAAVKESLLQEPAERDLFQAVQRLSGTNGGYEARLRALAGLRAPVDKFFDDVLVMAEDPAVRKNRLGLLSDTLALFYRIADISKLGG